LRGWTLGVEDWTSGVGVVRHDRLVRRSASPLKQGGKHPMKEAG
jgi:hypothetical protein